MSKPYIHAQSSAKRFGGKAEDYIELHSFMDCSKGAIPSSVHRALTHNSWFIMEVGERIKFSNSNPPTGDNRFLTIKNSDGKNISVRDIFEIHILEDFGNRFIPTAQDYLENMEYKDWMNNGNGFPPSFAKINEHRKRKNQKPLKIEEIVYDKRPQKIEQDLSVTNEVVDNSEFVLDLSNRNRLKLIEEKEARGGD